MRNNTITQSMLLNMKHYFKYTDENKVQCFIELNKEFYCERAIFKTKNKLINTYLEIEHNLYFLPEGSFKESIQFINTSSKTEFYQIWEKSTLKFEKNWTCLKNKYKIGEIVKSKILCFYPQGIISNFGETFNALSNYETCEKKFGKSNMYLNYELELKIVAFDNINKLIILKPYN